MKSTTTTNRFVRTFLSAKRVRVFAAVALLGVTAAACDVHDISEPGTLASISVTPNTTMAASSTQQMIAVGYDAEGRVVTIAPSWSVAASGGTIEQNGMFSAGTVPGSFANTVVATVGSISGRASIVVTAGALVSITIVPNAVTLASGSTQSFVAVGRDIAGNIVSFTPTWSVVAGGGAITQSGAFTAGATGTFINTVQASNSGMTGFATVIVTAAPTAGPLATITVTPNPVILALSGTQQFAATGRDAAGNTVAITPTWAVVAGGAISTAGLFTAGAVAGTFTNTISATSGSISGTATVTVTAAAPGALATITVTPTPATMPFGGVQQFTAAGTDALGNPVAITPVWTVVASGGAIATTGLFTAGAVAGTFTNTVRATSGSVSGFATVTVSAATLASITVTPSPVSLSTDSQLQFTAVGRDAVGNAFAITPVWTVVNGGGTVGTTGMFTSGGTTGTFSNTIKATSGTISGFATVTVTAPSAPGPLVPLGAAGPNGIMAGTAVTCITGGIINADVSISPGNTLTGFGPCVITGVRHLADAVAAQGQIDLTTAYNTLAGMACPPANAIVANLGGTTKPAGVYCTASGISVSGTLTLDGGGDPNAKFVFQAGSSLTTAGNIVLINGAQAGNVYWQVGSSATLGTSSQWQGNILALTSITLVDNATLFGRALARNGAVTLGTNNVITLP